MPGLLNWLRIQKLQLWAAGRKPPLEHRRNYERGVSPRRCLLRLLLLQAVSKVEQRAGPPQRRNRMGEPQTRVLLQTEVALVFHLTD